MTAKELDKLLSRFFKEVRKENGEDTNQVRSLHFKEASNATFLRRGYLLKYVKMKSIPVDIKSLPQNERASFRVVSATSQMPLTRKFTEEEQEKLFETGQFGDHDPLALQRTLWWFLFLAFWLSGQR